MDLILCTLSGAPESDFHKAVVLEGIQAEMQKDHVSSWGLIVLGS